MAAFAPAPKSGKLTPNMAHPVSGADNGFCRDCLSATRGDARCPECHSPRVLTHPQLNQLSIAHLDCDAFYAAVEKRDNPDLKDKPVIVGGGRRGVVSTACYIARIRGVGSAMPMFKALKRCPDAIVIRPNMEKYSAVGREVRRLMRDLTPLVEPLSIDEAFLDLSGTERLHGQSPARSLARLTAPDRRGTRGKRVDRPVGQQVSGQARIRSRQTARVFGVVQSRSRRVSGKQAGGNDLGRRQGISKEAGKRRHPHDRTAPGHGETGSDGAVRFDRCAPLSSRARRGQSAR